MVNLAKRGGNASMTVSDNVWTGHQYLKVTPLGTLGKTFYKVKLTSKNIRLLQHRKQ